MLGVRSVDWVDDRLGHVSVLERRLATGTPRAQHVEGHPGDDRRQPAAEVLDLAVVGAAEANPRLLDGVVSLAQ